MNKIPRVIFFGTDDFSVPFFREILDMNRAEKLKLVAVISKPDKISGRGKKLVSPEIVEISRKFNSEIREKNAKKFAKNPKNSEQLSAKNRAEIPIFQPEKVREINSEIDKLNFDAGILVSFGKIIPQSTLDVFQGIITKNTTEIFVKNGEKTSRKNRVGIINFHPSLLPKLRGPSPIETAILENFHETGLTLMKLAKEMDAGKILFQEKIALSGTETAPELREKMAARGREIFREKLVKIIKNLRENPDFGEKQNDENATFSRMFSKEDAILNPAEISASEAERKIRAFLSWPKARIAAGDFSRSFRTDFVRNFANNSAPSEQEKSEILSQKIIITAAEKLDFAPGDGWPDVISFAPENGFREKSALKIAKIVSPKSGKEMKFADFLNGMK